ncbi:MAG: NAD(P)-dependent oxidoreductase [Epsilonproteobacteria bacterium]|nr:MAG: NAD(P)-dependent oxidoreductase [Campylobacterota bacterium]
MTNYIKNKTALITGASSGIGRQIALDLATNSVNLILVSRDIKKLEALKKSMAKTSNIDIKIYSLDVQNQKEVKDTIDTILKTSTIDILINSAGLALGFESIDKGDANNWEHMIDTNIKGLLYVSRAIIPQMRDLKTAHIVNIGSVAGKISYPNGNVYCATKSAVHSIGESMNADLYGTNIKVSTIAPGAVKTNFSNVRFDGDKQKANTIYDGYTPLDAHDISNTIVNVLNTPPHVNIQYLDIMPTAQRNPYLLHKT